MSHRASRHCSDASMSASPVFDFIGGMRWSRLGESGGGNASIPLIRLSLFESGVRINSRWRAFNWLAPTIEVRYSEFENVRSVITEPFRSEGVRILASKADVAAIFWTRRPADVLNALEYLGVSVGREPMRVKNRTWTET